MTISLPGFKKQNSRSFFRRKSAERTAPMADKRLSGEEVARLFAKDKPVLKPSTTALNESEEAARSEQSSLRGALYSKK